MKTAVDPFIIQVPKKFQDDPELHEWCMYLHRHLHDMWVRSGAGNDNLGDVLGVVEGDPDASLPDDADPVWEGINWLGVTS